MIPPYKDEDPMPVAVGEAKPLNLAGKRRRKKRDDSVSVAAILGQEKPQYIIRLTEYGVRTNAEN